MNRLDDTLHLPHEKVQVRPAQLRGARTISGLKWRENLLAYIFLGPSLILFMIFFFYPMIQSVYLSLHSTDLTGRVNGFAGLDNFSYLFNNHLFFNGLKVTVYFALLTVPTGIILALILAALSNGKSKGLTIFQFAFSLPVVLSVGSSSVIWMFLFHPSLGMLNYFLSLLHLSPINWLVDPKWALLSVSIMTVWMNLGFNYIILSSGLRGIPDEIRESASIDGAGPLRLFGQILLPLLSPTLFFLVIVSVISSFQAFGQVNILTHGGPMNSTSVLVFSIYQEAFENFRFGTGSAQALVLFVIIIMLTLIQFKWAEKKVHYQ
ncbi:sn-glycerol 3-phosphate transport system permease protein [Paenibacillus cellulosilyticus]|uniref:sn-glycerol 3-phosphate transport system permease protein n=1 Tax=Paenibacillus cellulosilyticus TaxID=375489 RepID=A0A2V2YNR0_9BACL|nr:sugar ABC transporter permease [Paenibacillus cellulosilyticus]PWV97406.1 sn-glycerol 3-phosphate transport system permease protein [Paenibacillus cellulosilyticus]QKS48553.1 sugar ABC transporter permease [Paenibacillus cellulosilyticus]